MFQLEFFFNFSQFLKEIFLFFFSSMEAATIHCSPRIIFIMVVQLCSQDSNRGSNELIRVCLKFPKRDSDFRTARELEFERLEMLTNESERDGKAGSTGIGLRTLCEHTHTHIQC